jgi:hypothetical protein
LETTPDSAKDIVSNCREELVQSEYVQSEEKILSAGPEKYEKINHLMDEILSFLLRERD